MKNLPKNVKDLIAMSDLLDQAVDDIKDETKVLDGKISKFILCRIIARYKKLAYVLISKSGK